MEEKRKAEKIWEWNFNYWIGCNISTPVYDAEDKKQWRTLISDDASIMTPLWAKKIKKTKYDYGVWGKEPQIQPMTRVTRWDEIIIVYKISFFKIMKLKTAWRWKLVEGKVFCWLHALLSWSYSWIHLFLWNCILQHRI